MNSTFIPIKKAQIAIISGEAPEEMVTNLRNLGLEIIKTLPEKNLQREVAFHPDMVLFPMGVGEILTAPSVWCHYKRKLKDFGIIVSKGHTDPKGNYPEDIPYNAVTMENLLLHRLDMTDSKILDFARRKGLASVNVKQGYSKCSLALVDNRSGITSDRGIYNALGKKGYDILLIEPGNIELPGMEYGFIGGATGHISHDEMVITGRLEGHPDKDRIIGFIESKGIKIHFLSNCPIMDIGTIICLEMN